MADILRKLKPYFVLSLSHFTNSRLHELFPDAHHYMLRTPLFSICHYHYSPIMSHTYLISGWMIHWFPNWKYFKDWRQNLYLYELDWTRHVISLEELEFRERMHG